jgi:hypothetical protein
MPWVGLGAHIAEEFASMTAGPTAVGEALDLRLRLGERPELKKERARERHKLTYVPTGWRSRTQEERERRNRENTQRASKRWRDKNREYLRAAAAKYRDAHREELRAAAKRRRAKVKADQAGKIT